ncbi:MAG: AAA family ATPase [Chthoniobacterales bacterium]
MNATAPSSARAAPVVQRNGAHPLRGPTAAGAYDARTAAASAELEMARGHEQTVLAAALDGYEIPQAIASPESFIVPAHREMAKAVFALQRTGVTPNLLSLTDSLREAGRLDAVGGISALTSLSLTTVTPPIFEYSVGEMLVTAKRRLAGFVGAKLAQGSITAEQAVDILQREIEPAAFPTITDAADLVERETDTPPDLVDGLLHKVGKLVFGGSSKSFKTWTLINLAVSVALGCEFLGRRTTKGRVLFVNLEIQGAFFARRIAMVCSALGLSVESLRGNLDVWNLRGHAADLSRMLPFLLSKIRSGDYGLIVADPIYKLLGARDENKAGDIASLLNDLEKLAVHSGAAVAFGAHYSKGNQAAKESIDRIGGSGVFARDPDSIVTFTRHEAADAFTVDCVLRNHPPIEPFVVQWEFPLMRIEGSLDPERLRKPAGRKQEYRTDDVLGLLVEPMTTTDWQTLAESELHLSKSTFHRRLKEIKNQGLARQRDDQKWEAK